MAGDSMTEVRTPSTARLFGAGLAAMALALAAMVALPHDPYVRWQAPKLEAEARLGWLYERIHQDPTPIDVAFIGTSHTLNGIDAAAVQQAIAAQGLRNPDGSCVTVTNLAIPAYGRSLHWEIARELLSVRKPKLLVIEVFESETRKAHPYFADVGTVGDIVGAPMLVNVGYVKDLIRLPYRQLTLALKSLNPKAVGLKTRFDPADYDGSNVDNTRYVNVAGAELTPYRDKVMPAADLQRAAARAAARKEPNVLGPAFAQYEYAVPRHYLGNILALARARGVPVRFLYLPGYGRPAAPVPLAGMRIADRTLYVNDILKDDGIWYDAEHLNAQGAVLLSRRLGTMLGPIVGTSAPKAAGGTCRFGYPQRPNSVPFKPARH